MESWKDLGSVAKSVGVGSVLVVRPDKHILGVVNLQKGCLSNFEICNKNKFENHQAVKQLKLRALLSSPASHSLFNPHRFGVRFSFCLEETQPVFPGRPMSKLQLFFFRNVSPKLLTGIVFTSLLTALASCLLWFI